MTPKFAGIDHCHLEVSDMNEALAWYNKTLGFTVVAALEFWYHQQQNAPLTLEDSAKTVRLALFETPDMTATKGIAFAASGVEFINWLTHLSQQNVRCYVADHHVTYSLYFRDPFANSHEITSHDYQVITTALKALNITANKSS